MKEGPFDIDFSIPNRVIEIHMDDGSKSRFAIQLSHGGYWGQKWEVRDGVDIRTYPIWKTKRAAEKKLQKLIDNGEVHK
jgi:hypothetical protein